MPNLFREERITDTNHRALIKLVGIFDGTGQASNLTMVDVSSLAFALNANGQIMSSNTHPLGVYNVSIKRIMADVNMNGFVRLQWGSRDGVTPLANVEAIVLGPGYKDINFASDGYNGLLKNPIPGANTTGDLLISTLGAGANNSFTIFLELKKDGSHYDAGQTADPAAFNRGDWRLR